MTKKQILTVLGNIALVILVVMITSLLLYRQRPATLIDWVKFLLAVMIAVLAVLLPISTILKNVKDITPEKLNSPLKAKTAAKLLDEYMPSDFLIDWIDRRSPGLNELRDHRRLLLVGPRKIGKTRAALQLVRLAETGLLPAGRIFDLDPLPFRTASSQALNQALCRDLKPGLPVLVFIDDLLYNYAGDALDRLADGLRLLERHAELYIVSTARQEHIDADHPGWPEQHGFKAIPLEPLEPVQIGALVDVASAHYGLRFEAPARQIFIDRADGTPELTLLGLNRLKYDQKHEIGEDLARQYAESSLSQAIETLRQELVRDHACSAFLLSALDAFYAACVGLDAGLVLNYAAYLWRRQAFFALPLRRTPALRRALVSLRPYGVDSSQDQLHIQKDILFEDRIDPSTARVRLANFLSRHLLFANRLLRGIYPSAVITARVYMELGNLASSEMNYPDALRLHTASIRFDPSFTFAWFNRGNTLRQLGKYRQALASYERGLEIGPQDAYAWSDCGAILTDHLGEPRQGLASFNRALEIDPQLIDAWIGRGVALEELGEPSQALASYDQVLKIDPQYAQAWQYRGDILYELGEHLQALDSYDRALEVDPQLARVWSIRGGILNGMSEYRQAVASFNRALEINPQDAEVWSDLGATLTDDLGEPSQGLVCFDRALEIDPQNAIAWHNRGIALEKLGKFRQALDSFDHALEINPRYADAWYSRGGTLSELGEHRQALASYDRTLEIEPQDAQTWNNRGTILTDELNEPLQGLSSFDRALEIDPQLVQAWIGRGVALGRLGEHRQALASYDRALEINPQDAGAWSNRGATLTDDLCDPRQGLASFDRALKINPKYTLAWHNRGIALGKLGKHRQALDSFNHALTIDPQYGSAMYNMACTFAHFHNEAQACNWLEQAFQTDNSYIAKAQNDTDFNAIRDGTRFQTLLARYSLSS